MERWKPLRKRTFDGMELFLTFFNDFKSVV